MAYQPPFNGPAKVTLGGNSTSAGAGYALISTGTMMLAGGSNVTLSQNGNSISAYGPVFSNSNAISFGTNGQTITASYGQSNQTQNNVQAAVMSGNTTGTTASISSGTLTLAGGSNITLSQNSGNALTVYGPVFSNSNAFTFGTNGQAITASYSQSIQTQDIVQAVVMDTNGNTAGATASISSGTLLLAGGNNITLSQNGNDLTISNALSAHATLNSYEPYPNIVGVNSTFVPSNTATSGPAYFWPFVVVQNVSAGMIEMIASMSINASAFGAFSQSISDQVGIYIRGTGASSTMFSQMTSRELTIAMSYTRSTMTISQPTVSSTSGYGYLATSSAGLAITGLYTGYKLIQFPLASAMTPGNYWLGMMNLSSTVGGNSGLARSYWAFSNSYVPMTALAPIGSNTSAFTSGSGAYVGYANWSIGWGSYSEAGLNSLPSIVPIASISQNIEIIPYFKFVVGT